jgi:hypothetical protein
MSNNKQQTAVEWLFDKMFDPTYPAGEQINWLEHAKEMEKEQTIDFAFNALKIADNTMNGYVDVDKLYKELYGGGEQ